MLTSPKAMRVAQKRVVNGKTLFMIQNRTMYGIFHNEGRCDPVFKPQYDEHGQNLNADNVWHLRPCPPCSITGKPRRQLGHYPKMGHPIVPFHRLDYRATCDNHRTPTPWYDEPPSGVSLKEMNWLQIRILAAISLIWWLYTVKHYFRECDELYKQNKCKEFPFPNPFYYVTPNYYYRPNTPEKKWISCNEGQQIEQVMVWNRWKTKNNAGVWFNMWLAPIEYDKNGNLIHGKFAF